MIEFLLGNTLGAGVLTVIVAVIAFKLAFFTIKRVVWNLILGGIVYAVAVHVFNISLDAGVGLWALTALFGPIPMILVALWHLF